jgi:pimeloyl-ACP methyl ester carboxylesterase
MCASKVVCSQAAYRIFAVGPESAKRSSSSASMPCFGVSARLRIPAGTADHDSGIRRLQLRRDRAGHGSRHGRLRGQAICGRASGDCEAPSAAGFRAPLERGDFQTLIRENAVLFRRPWYNWLIQLKLWKDRRKLGIGGTADQLFDRSAFEETASLIPGARLRLFEGETHMLPIERRLLLP